MAQKDYYSILGVSKTASDAEIKAAYRKLAQKHHPDKKTGDEAKFKEINEAYQVLSNKEKRAQYDRFGQTFRGGAAPGGAGFGGFNGTINVEDLGDFSDIFESFFGGGRGGARQRTRTRRGSDLQIRQKITLEEAYTGVKKELSFTAFVPCETCTGKGYDEEKGVKKCTACDGKGETREVQQTILGSVQQVRTCATCRGEGKTPNAPCKTCSGGGRVEKKRKETIQIASGIESGQLIKVAGKGEAGEKGAPAGDLYVQVVIEPHRVFRRSGADLYLEKEMNMLDVLRGKKLQFTTIAGKKKEVAIPEGFIFSERLKVRGEGMPQLHGSRKGNLYIAIHLKKPKKVSKRAKKAFDELDGEVS